MASDQPFRHIHQCSIMYLHHFFFIFFKCWHPEEVHLQCIGFIIYYVVHYYNISLSDFSLEDCLNRSSVREVPFFWAILSSKRIFTGLPPTMVDTKLSARQIEMVHPLIVAILPSYHMISVIAIHSENRGWVNYSRSNSAALISAFQK